MVAKIPECQKRVDIGCHEKPIIECDVEPGRHLAAQNMPPDQKHWPKTRHNFFFVDVREAKLNLMRCKFGPQLVAIQELTGQITCFPH